MEPSIAPNPAPQRGMKELFVFLARIAPSIKIVDFDIGGTLAEKDTPPSEVVEALVTLAKAGVSVGIISGKAIDAVAPWMEGQGGLVALADAPALAKVRVYSDRVTKAYEFSDGRLKEVSRIPFPIAVDKAQVADLAGKAAQDLQSALTSSPSLNDEVKALLKASPLKAKVGDEYVQVCSKVDIEVKGDSTGADARKLIKKHLEEVLQSAGLLVPELTIVLDGKKGAFIKSRSAEKPGAIIDHMNAVGAAPAEVIYVADQWTGKSTADLCVASTGVYGINVGPDAVEVGGQVFNAELGPQGSVRFINDFLAARSVLPREPIPAGSD